MHSSADWRHFQLDFSAASKPGFSCAFSQKLKAKKTQALEKTQGFSDPKLNVPVVSYNLSRKNSSFVTKTQDFCSKIEKIWHLKQKWTAKNANYEFPFKLDEFLQKLSMDFIKNSKILPKTWHLCPKNSRILPKNSRKLLKNSIVRWFLKLAPTGNPHKKKPVLSAPPPCERSF